MSSDWLKDVGEAFERIGRGAKAVADDVRKVVGIGVGSIHLELQHLDFAPGDVIAGELRLALSEPTEAKRVVVALVGTRDRTIYDKDAQGRRVPRTHRETVYRLERELGGAASYLDEVLPFELLVPGDATSTSPKITAEGWIGDVARVVSSVASATRNAIQWRVTALVHIPWRRNVRTHVDIGVAQL
jgi:hypothetical protein